MTAAGHLAGGDVAQEAPSPTHSRWVFTFAVAGLSGEPMAPNMLIFTVKSPASGCIAFCPSAGMPRVIKGGGAAARSSANTSRVQAIISSSRPAARRGFF
jgi:hypothetical protein